MLYFPQQTWCDWIVFRIRDRFSLVQSCRVWCIIIVLELAYVWPTNGDEVWFQTVSSVLDAIPINGESTLINVSIVIAKWNWQAQYVIPVISTVFLTGTVAKPECTIAHFLTYAEEIESSDIWYLESSTVRLSLAAQLGRFRRRMLVHGLGLSPFAQLPHTT